MKCYLALLRRKNFRDISKTPKLSLSLNATRVFLWFGWHLTGIPLFSPSLKLPPCGLEGQCGAVRPQTRNTHVVKLLWTGILIKKARKTAGWSLFSKEMQQSVLCSVFSSASLFCPFSLCPDRTQILITWWDYISRPCVCNRACGFSYNLHEPL